MVAMRRSLVAGVVLAVSVAAVAGIAAAPGKPTMKLRVSTHSGPTPLTLDLTGSFMAVQPADFSGCVVTVERNYKTPGGTHLNSKEELPCGEQQAVAPAASMPPSFKQAVTLKEPGVYSLRMVLIDKEGKRFASTSQEVKAYDGHVSIGIGVSVGSNRR